MLRKSANTSTFSWIIFVGISEIWEAFLVSKWKTSLSMSCVVTFVKKIVRDILIDKLRVIIVTSCVYCTGYKLPVSSIT